MVPRWSLFLSTLALLACGTSGVAPVSSPEFTLEQAGDSIPLTLGRESRVGDVWMVLTDVPSDSRCPVGVVCVWAGDAVAAIAVHPGCYKEGCKAPSALLQLHTTLEPRGGEALGYKVTLVDLRPLPTAGKATDKRTYVAWVRVTR